MSNKTTLQTNNSTINTNNSELATILNAINNLPSGGGVNEPQNIFTNDYSQVGYAENYIKSTGYTTTNVLWSDLPKYTGQNTTWYVTNPIPIESDTYYKYEGFSSGNNPGACFLGEDKTTIYEGIVYKGEGTFYTPKNAKYIVMTVAKANIETMSVKEMTEAEIKVLEMDKLVNRTITSYSSDTLTSVGSNAFQSCSKLTTVSLPNATSLGLSSFNACSSLVSIEVPKVTSITTQTFYGCDALETLNLPSVKTTGTQGVRHCDKLTRVDFGAVTNIGALTFDSCPLLDTLIVRTASVCTLVNTSALTGTLIASGTGYIYVPDTLVDSYKSASNWSTYASQIKPLSELEV